MIGTPQPARKLATEAVTEAADNMHTYPTEPARYTATRILCSALLALSRPDNTLDSRQEARPDARRPAQ